MIHLTTELRSLYPAPKGRALSKQLDRLDVHCRRFIGLCPFVVLASGGANGAMDASPRGGEPGFVKVLDDRTLLLPDSRGNNRLDTLENLIETGRIGMLFMVPGVDETLRVNGSAKLVGGDVHAACFAGAKRAPKLVIEVSVADAYLHCAKALMRAGLWDASRHVMRSSLPSMGQMLNDQTGSDAPVEDQDAMVARYAADL